MFLEKVAPSPANLESTSLWLDCRPTDGAQSIRIHRLIFSYVVASNLLEIVVETKSTKLWRGIIDEPSAVWILLQWRIQPLCFIPHLC